MTEGDWDQDLQLPWCLALEADPAWERIPTNSLIPRPSTESSLVAELLHNARGIRAMRMYLKYTDSSSESENRDNDVREACIIFSLGNGVNGNANVCHGGFVSLMLDEAAGELANHFLSRNRVVTVSMTLTYKKKIFTPAVVLSKASIIPEKSHGRKATVQGIIEDGQGTVYAIGETCFVRLSDRKL